MSDVRWEPLPDGKELRLWQGQTHQQGTCYIVTRNSAAGRKLPNGYAVCRAVPGEAASPAAPPAPKMITMSEDAYNRAIAEAFEFGLQGRQRPPAQDAPAGE